MGITRERHIEYANRITELQTSAGEMAKKAALAHAKKLLDLSNGNLRVFKSLLEKTKKQYLKSVLKIVIQEQQKARLIGKEFSNGI